MKNLIKAFIVTGLVVGLGGQAFGADRLKMRLAQRMAEATAAADAIKGLIAVAQSKVDLVEKIAVIEAAAKAMGGLDNNPAARGFLAELISYVLGEARKAITSGAMDIDAYGRLCDDVGRMISGLPSSSKELAFTLAAQRELGVTVEVVTAIVAFKKSDIDVASRELADAVRAFKEEKERIALERTKAENLALTVAEAQQVQVARVKQATLALTEGFSDLGRAGVGPVDDLADLLA